jgi:hypothetical protein
MPYLAVAVAVVYGYLAYVLAKTLVLRDINAVAFIAQIQKLVMANSTDKAIKLCNAAPRATLAKSVKAMLVVSRRSRESIVMVHDAGSIALQAVVDHANALVFTPQLGLVALATIALLGGSDPHAAVPIYIAAGLFVLCFAMWYRIRNSFCAQAAYLTKVKDLLLKRFNEASQG